MNSRNMKKFQLQNIYGYVTQVRAKYPNYVDYNKGDVHNIQILTACNKNTVYSCCIRFACMLP